MEKTEVIKTEANELLKKIIDKFEIEVMPEEDVYQIVIKSEEEAPVVIGRHGETIRAIQKILEVILYKKLGEPTQILVNVNDYREKQKERLERIASELSDKVIQSSRPTYFGGLSSYERKIIHEFITANYPDLTTYSTGEGKGRKLVIDLKSNTPVKEEVVEA
ncbi:KH domain-containing protein [Candidatus Roizmanbacteria bacterium]|jgi:spoIIIJ-associated protein|nr:KH domain-containing protein [Candidatus Roizmanbacteria bacterium]